MCSKNVYSLPYGIIAKMVKENVKSPLYGIIAKLVEIFQFHICWYMNYVPVGPRSPLEPRPYVRKEQ